MAQTQPEARTKLVLEIDITEAMKWGELAPGHPGNNNHNWSEEQANYIVGFVLRKLGEDLMDITNQPCIDYADYDEMDYREGLFKSASYDETVPEDSPENNLMDMQESAMSVAIEIAQACLREAQARGMDMNKTTNTVDRTRPEGRHVILWHGTLVCPRECNGPHIET